MRSIARFSVFLLILLISPALAIDLPPLSEARREYYKLEFLPDGYPGRRMDSGVVPHPLYGTYVVNDYLSLFRGSRDPRYLVAARTVADAAIARMTDVEGALVFHYTPEMKLTTLPGTFYSGLTQSRYLSAFSALAKTTGDEKYKTAAERVLLSLTIPVEHGGVARHVRGGIVIEEWPHQMMGDYTLNGWTTAVVLLANYVAETGSPAARDLFEKNLRPLKSLLPLYDIPELANTRYRLSGPAQVRLVFEGTEGRFSGGAVRVPGEGTFDFDDAENVWHNHMKAGATPQRAVLNAVLNYASFPAMNSLSLDIEAAEEGAVTIEILSGTYHPLKKLTDKRWISIGAFALRAGTNKIEAAIPWSAASASIGPTDFKKKWQGANYNVYHYIHIANIEKLWQVTGDAIFKTYAERWAAAAARWPSMPLYRDAGVAMTRFGSKANSATDD